MSELRAAYRETPAAPHYPTATPEGMASLVDLLATRGVELKVIDTGELRFRDAAKRLTPADRRTIRHYAEPLAAWLASRATESPKTADSSECVAVACCDRCGSTEFSDVEIHDGQSVRRDCVRCRRTWGFAVWHGRI